MPPQMAQALAYGIPLGKGHVDPVHKDQAPKQGILLRAGTCSSKVGVLGAGQVRSHDKLVTFSKKGSWISSQVKIFYNWLNFQWLWLPSSSGHLNNGLVVALRMTAATAIESSACY